MNTNLHKSMLGAYLLLLGSAPAVAAPGWPHTLRYRLRAIFPSVTAPGQATAMAITTAPRSRVTAATTTVIGTDTAATASLITMDIIIIVDTTAFADTVAFAITTGLAPPTALNANVTDRWKADNANPGYGPAIRTPPAFAGHGISHSHLAGC